MLVEQPGRFETTGWRSWALSVALHALTVLALVLLVPWKQSRSAKTETIRRVQVVLADVNPQPTLLEAAQVASEQPTGDPALADALPDSPPPPVIDAPVGPGNRLDPATVNTTDAGRLIDAPRGFGRHEVDMTLTDEERKRIAAEQAELAALTPKGDPTTINVFGSGDLTGHKFVFVLDRSQSMGDQGLGVVRAARDRLTAAINQLESNHQFQIVAYHHQTVVIQRRRLLDATDENKRLVPEFIDNLAAFGGTRHVAGLNAALAFQPDVIVLLTDGGTPQLNESQLEAITRYAGGRTQIHCIQFGLGPPPELGRFMRQLALANRGTFRYVNVQALDQK